MHFKSGAPTTARAIPHPDNADPGATGARSFSSARAIFLVTEPEVQGTRSSARKSHRREKIGN